MRHRFLCIAIVAALGTSACSSFSEPVAGLSVTASAAAFALPDVGGLSVPYTVANQGAEPVRLTGSCDDDPAAVLERRLRRRWTTFGGGICLGIFPSGGVVLEPGAIRESSSGVHVAEPGEYRFVIDTDRGRVASPSFAVR
jgi:hypothetical protein